MSTPDFSQEKKKRGRPQAEPEKGSVGARVRELRELAGLSQAQLGERVGLKEKMIYRGEQKSNFSNAALINLARELKDNLGKDWLEPYAKGAEVAAPIQHADIIKDGHERLLLRIYRSLPEPLRGGLVQFADDLLKALEAARKKGVREAGGKGRKSGTSSG